MYAYVNSRLHGCPFWCPSSLGPHYIFYMDVPFVYTLYRERLYRDNGKENGIY